MQTRELLAEKRLETGKKVRKLRETGKIPAVFYGRKTQATSIAVPFGDFSQILNTAGESSVIRLKLKEGDKDVLIHDVSFDPVKGTPIHVDFYVVEADRSVEVSVPLLFDGISPAVKEQGGTLVKVLHELEVRGLPKNLPQELSVDIAPLKTLESQITAKDITLPAGIELVTDSQEIVAAISVAKEEEEAPQEEFDASKVEVEEKGKKEEVSSDE